MEENEGSDSDSLLSVESSTEGEYSMSDQSPFSKFDATAWSPKEGSDAMSYLCLIPFSNSYNPQYAQSEKTGKMKVSTAHRNTRLKEFKCGRTTGKNIVDEKHLRMAANSNDLSTVLELLESGVDTCCYDDKKRTPLHFAASQGFESVVKALLDKGANPNAKDILGNTPLHLAACTGHVPVVTLLLKAGTDIKLVDRFGRTPSSVAKSRLKFLAEVKGYSSQKVKDEALKVCEMLKTYLGLSGMSSDVEHLDKLCDRLQHVSTREEVDQINLLLSDLACLSITHKQNR